MSFQTGAAMLDACVLAVLGERDVYGYELTVHIKSVIDISENSLYPVLRRLQRDGCLTTYDRPYNGRNRRYYSITGAGRQKLAQYRTDWENYKKNMDLLMGGKYDASPAQAHAAHDAPPAQPSASDDIPPAQPPVAHDISPAQPPASDDIPPASHTPLPPRTAANKEETRLKMRSRGYP